jgi:hypothetical protein
MSHISSTTPVHHNDALILFGVEMQITYVAIYSPQIVLAMFYNFVLVLLLELLLSVAMAKTADALFISII